MSKKFTWKELCENAVSFTGVKDDGELLREIKEGMPLGRRQYIACVRGSKTCDGNDEYGRQSFMRADRIDVGDGSPVSFDDYWLSHRDYHIKFVVVPASIFNQETATQTTPTNPNSNSGATTMAQVTNRRIVRIELLDNDAGLDVAHCRVAVFNNIVTEDDDATTIQEVIMTKDVAAKLAAHNLTRVTQVNLDIQQRTGQEVKLLPVKLKDLSWVVKA